MWLKKEKKLITSLPIFTAHNFKVGGYYQLIYDRKTTRFKDVTHLSPEDVFIDMHGNRYSLSEAERMGLVPRMG